MFHSFVVKPDNSHPIVSDAKSQDYVTIIDMRKVKKDLSCVLVGLALCFPFYKGYTNGDCSYIPAFDTTGSVLGDIAGDSTHFNDSDSTQRCLRTLFAHTLNQIDKVVKTEKKIIDRGAVIHLSSYMGQRAQGETAEVIKDLAKEDKELADRLQLKEGQAVRNQHVANFAKVEGYKDLVRQYYAEEDQGKEQVRKVNNTVKTIKDSKQSLSPSSDTGQLLLQTASMMSPRSGHGGGGYGSKENTGMLTSPPTLENLEKSSDADAFDDKEESSKLSAEQVESPFKDLNDAQELALEGNGLPSHGMGSLKSQEDTEKALDTVENSDAYQSLQEKVGEEIAKEHLAKVKKALEEEATSLSYVQGRGSSFGNVDGENSELSELLKIASAALKGDTPEEMEELRRLGDNRGPSSVQGSGSRASSTLFERVHRAIRRHF